MLTKTSVDLIGTVGAKQTIAGAATALSNSRDLSLGLGLMIVAAATYGVNIPASDLLVEIFTSPDNVNFGTEAYESFYVPRLANNNKQLSFPVRFAECIKYYKVKVTNGATYSADIWIAAVEVTP